MPARSPRSHFRGPVRIQATGSASEYASGVGANYSGALGGIMVASNIGADPKFWLNPVNGDLVDNNSNLIIDWDARKVRCSSVFVGVSGTDTEITAIRVYSSTIGSGSIGANSIVLSSYTVTGLATGDKVIVIPPNSGISSGGGGSQLGIAYAGVSAADTLFIGWLNPTGASNVHVTNTYTILAIRS